MDDAWFGDVVSVIFFPLVWLSVYLILEPLNVWFGYRSLVEFISQRDWRPVIGLCIGALTTGCFWEMWNYYSYPKWIYTIPWVDYFRIFEMPILGYWGYLPFALELSVLYHLVTGILGDRCNNYLLSWFFLEKL